ncbi:MAG: hypothetical protein A2151_08090 [Candidatus Muproteobacteria bacterium RBG_16_65_34]|uniref:Cytochrome c domain-containing protein n=1 Tax=Candidatus Muproteobacteria bacterium RBG_16_65_34 TaxID=1817760 RepID=A0A1F6TPJ6_9PROT|nr:MAG: hypothetical protein A2151_08090 [Candidatus Muproteobacteria bacterium RBG_16_65_34]
MRKVGIGQALLAALWMAAASAASPTEVQRSLEQTARATTPGFAGFSAHRGEKFFKSTHGGEWSCASCHTQDPRASGRHAKTEKEIRPLSPVADPRRFTDPAKVEKWFRRNCNDVVGRACTPLEKGDVLAYVMSVRK